MSNKLGDINFDSFTSSEDIPNDQCDETEQINDTPMIIDTESDFDIKPDKLENIILNNSVLENKNHMNTKSSNDTCVKDNVTNLVTYDNTNMCLDDDSLINSEFTITSDYNEIMHNTTNVDCENLRTKIGSVIINTVQNDLFTENSKLSDIQSTYNKMQKHLTKLIITEKYEILSEISKIYSSICNIMDWYCDSFEKIKSGYDSCDSKTNYNKASRLTITISNVIKLSFLKKYGINSIFNISYEDHDLYRGEYVSYDDRRNITSDCINIVKLYYVHGIKIYNIKDNVFKFSLIGLDCQEEHLFEIGSNFLLEDDKTEFFTKIDDAKSKSCVIYDYFKKESGYVDTISDSLSLLLKNY